MASVYVLNLDMRSDEKGYIYPNTSPSIENGEYFCSVFNRHQRDFDNASEGSSAGSMGSFYSPSPRALDTPSPNEPASASKLYDLLKNPNSYYNTVDTWDTTCDIPFAIDEHGALDLKRRIYEEPMDLSFQSKKRRKEPEETVTLECRSSVSPEPWRYKGPEERRCSAGGSTLESMLSGKVSLRDTAQASAQAWEEQKDRQVSHLLPVPHTCSSFVSPPSPFSTASFTCSSRSASPNKSQSLVTSSGRNQRVRLAKKVLLPVTAKVSDWILKITNFGQSLPDFSSLSYTDKILLILNSWSRILLLFMAENNFEFAVTPINDLAEKTGEREEEVNMRAEEYPTMFSVDQIQSFVRKLQKLRLDSEEYHFLKMITLFASDSKLESPKFVNNVNTCARHALQDRIRATPSKSILRYSKLLLCLPQLYTINSKMMENLFCRHLTDNTDIELVLKEMIHK